MTKYYLFLFVFFIGLFTACLKPDEFDDIPEITNISFTKNNIHCGTDSVIAIIEFQDGDGDVGTTESTVNLYFQESRPDIGLDSVFLYEFSVHDLEPEGIIKAISGTIDVVVTGGTYCWDTSGGVYCDNAPEVKSNQIVYDVWLYDKSGRKSNVYQTPAIHLSCYP